MDHLKKKLHTQLLCVNKFKLVQSFKSSNLNLNV